MRLQSNNNWNIWWLKIASHLSDIVNDESMELSQSEPMRHFNESNFDHKLSRLTTDMWLFANCVFWIWYVQTFESAIVCQI